MFSLSDLKAPERIKLDNASAASYTWGSLSKIRDCSGVLVFCLSTAHKSLEAASKVIIINIYRRVTGRTPDNTEVDELIEFYEYVQKNEMEQFKTKSRAEVKQRAYTSLTLLIYNLDETTQKS